MIAAAAKIREWRENPVAFVREVFKVEPDLWQVDMLQAYATHNRTVAAACKGPGKTTVLAWAGWNFLATRPHCKVPCTSITGANLADGLWTEFSKWQKRSTLLQQAFQWTKTRVFLKEHPETWWASARQWAHDAEPEKQADTLAGLHEEYLLFLIDEVSEIPDGVVSAAEAALTGGTETKLLMAGNCTRTEGPLWRACGADRHLWKVIRITGDPDNPKRSPRIDIEEARRQIEKYGRDSYIVRVNILGEFPERQADKLIDIRDCEQAMDRAVVEAVFVNEPKVLGVDVARFGGDESIIFPRQGRMGFQLKDFRQLDTVSLADEVVKSAKKFDADGVLVDGVGVGAGVVDQLRSLGHGDRVHEVNAGSRAMDDERFENKRAEMYWLAAEWVRAGGCLPKDQLLAAELCAPRYFFDKKQRVCLEPSDDVKARLGRSPDRASAFVLTFARPIARRSRNVWRSHSRATEGRAETEFDPYAREEA